MSTIPPVSRLMARSLALLIVALIALCATVAAMAAPIIYAQPYPATAVQPDAVTLTINGGAPQPCELRDTPAGKEPRCDLASITAPGVYTLVMTAIKNPSIVATPGGAINDVGGSASSAPFRYERRSGGVDTPVLRVAP